MKKLLASAVVLGLFTFGCCGDIQPYFDIVGLNLHQGPYFLNEARDSATFENYSIFVTYQTKFYSQHSKPFSLVPAAIAHSCADPGYKGTKEKIETFEVFALSDFNQQFRSGSQLNAIVNIEGSPVEEDIIRQNGHSIRFSSQLTFTQKPDSTVKQAFRVKIKLTNGETYTAETAPVTIL